MGCETEKSGAPGCETLRVLIAEDEWLVAFTLREQLEQRGCEVVGIAKTGQEAVEQCLAAHPDVVLMDIRMPVLDGLEATKRVMQEQPTCVVMLTAGGRPADVAKAEEAGAMAYLVKPVSGDQILPAIEMARRRFREFVALQNEVEELQGALETRKVVEKAKGLLMERAGLGEADAFRRMQKMAMDRRMTMKQVAEKVLAAAEAADEFFRG